MNTLRWILISVLAFYAGKSFEAYEHRPIVVEIHQSRPLPGLKTAQAAIELIPGVPSAIDYPKFDTISEAIFEALKTIARHPSSAYYEWGGGLFQTPDGKYSFTQPTTDWAGDHVQLSGHAPGKIVGGYHTHPCLPDHDVEYFSPEDLMAPTFQHVIAVMGDFCTGNIHVFIPGDQPDVEHPPGDPNVFLTHGRIMGKFTVNIGPPPL